MSPETVVWLVCFAAGVVVAYLSGKHNGKIEMSAEASRVIGKAQEAQTDWYVEYQTCRKDLADDEDGGSWNVCNEDRAVCEDRLTQCYDTLHKVVGDAVAMASEGGLRR